MPKTKSALKEARALLKKVQIKITDSSSDSEASSLDSGEFSHIPVEETPDICSLTLENITMEQISAQMSSLTQMMQQLMERQDQQQLAINSLSLNQPNVAATPQQNRGTMEDFFKLPDPIKVIPKFDGSRKQLTAWLTTVENTLEIFKPLVTPNQFAIYVSAVIHKIEGKAKDIICLAGNPQTFEEIQEILTNALGDRQELTFYKSQLWQNKMMDTMSIHKYYSRCKEITQNIKTLAKQKQKYKDNWDAINAFIEEDALAAFLAGLKEPYFGYAQAACPEDMEAAYAFVCKFRSKEATASNMEQLPTRNRQKHKNFRNDEKKEQTERQDRQDRKFENKESTQPMDIGSTRSKLTLNRKQLYNTEIAEPDKSSESESEDENIDLNFCWTQQKVRET